MNNKLTHKLVEKIAIIFLLIVIIIIAVYYFVFKIDWVKIYTTQNTSEGKKLSALSESCIKCHGNVKGFSQFHNPQKIGCSSCHLGNKFSKDKNTAHEGTVLIPGNRVTANQTCGQTNCHPGIPERIDSSLMSTMSGVISVDKFAFNELAFSAGKFRIEKIGRSAAETHLRNLCASCHLGNEKRNFGPITELSRGGGCNACHLNYKKEALNELKIYDSLKTIKSDSVLIKIHPTLSINITNNHCFGCHSRSGRISTNYEGWHETNLTDREIVDSKNYRLLKDGRIFKKVIPDVHFDAGLACIDCHISYEIMGDGKFYEHKEQQILVQCEDCHLIENKETITLEKSDFESQKIAKVKGMTDENRRFIKVKKSQTPLLNTYVENKITARLIGKLNNRTYNLLTSKPECTAKAHNSLSCNSCHAAWAPQCIGCHTDYKPNVKGFDLLNNKETDSTWVEYNGGFFAELPTLGIKKENVNGRIKNKVETFIPGMIMSLDKNKFDNKEHKIMFNRLFALSIPHTVRKESRSCGSCHNNSLALGYGRGKLEYIIYNNIGRWIFEPKYKLSEFDNLPEDAWIGFLQTRSQNMATRINIRPFNLEEQKRILLVGACLTCHNSDSEVMKNSLNNFQSEIKKISKECILPTWN